MNTVRLGCLFRLLSGRREKRVFADLRALSAYLGARPPTTHVEQLRVLFLDRSNGLLSDEVLAFGTRSDVIICPRAIMTRALELRARGLILVHNHPSGDARPSRADVEATRHLVDAARLLGIIVHDHIIVAGSLWSSFRVLGLL
jgi:DNA repair protein RadC